MKRDPLTGLGLTDDEKDAIRAAMVHRAQTPKKLITGPAFVRMWTSLFGLAEAGSVALTLLQVPIGGTLGARDQQYRRVR